jgi:16S rRNA (guanine527-N7)-methyltransferase
LDRSERPPKDKAPPGDALVIQWRIDKWFPELPEPMRAKFKRFHTELLKFNKSLTLIAAKSVYQADAAHFADCILASRAIFSASKIDEIYDFGSGNGFPGLIFAVMFPQVKVHLVEMDSRKAEYLSQMIGLLELSNAKVIAKQIETLPPASVRFAMSRGFASISKALLTTRKAFMKDGRYFHIKGEQWASEIASIPTQLCTFWRPGLIAEYKLPVGEIKFAVVNTDKIAD